MIHVSLVPIQLHRCVRPDPTDFFTHVGQLFTRFQFFGSRRFDISQMLVNPIQRFVILQQLDTCFFTDTRHARQVIRTIALQRFQVQELMDIDAIFVFKIPNVELLDIAQPVFQSIDFCVRRDQLQRIQIAGQQTRLDTLFSSLHGKSPQYIVGLVVVDFIEWPAKRLQQLVQQWDLFIKIRRRRFATGFVFRINLAAFSNICFLLVPGDGHIVGFQFFNQFNCQTGKPKHATCWCPITRTQSGHSIIPAVKYRFSVNNGQSLHILSIAYITD